MTSEIKRVFLWMHPRSLSTAFIRCMEGIPNTKIVFEPYACAVHYGPDGDLVNLPGFSPDAKYSYQDVKEILQHNYEDTDLVFAKDLAYCLDGRYDMLPSGFQHTFLIRHPIKAFVSYFRIITVHGEGNGYMDKGFPKGYFYGELVELYKHLLSKGEKDIVIIDADDLLENPDLMMRSYCQAIGVDYRESMLHWGPGNTDEWITSKIMMEKTLRLPWHENSLKAGGFSKSISKPAPPLEELPPKVRQCVQEAMPYYEELYQLRERVC